MKSMRLALFLLVGTAWAETDNLVKVSVGSTSNKIEVTHKDRTYQTPVAAGEHCGWSCFMNGFEDGGLDMCDAIISGMTHTPARDEFLAFTTGYFTNEWGVLGKLNAAPITDRAQLNAADVTIIVEADASHAASAGKCEGVTGQMSTDDCTNRMKQGTGGTAMAKCKNADDGKCTWTAGEFDAATFIYIWGECRTCDCNGASCCASGDETTNDVNNATCGGVEWTAKTCTDAGGAWAAHADLSDNLAAQKDGGVECHKLDHAIWIADKDHITALFKGEGTVAHPTGGATWTADAKTYMIQDEAYVTSLEKLHTDAMKKVFNFPDNTELAENFAIAQRQGEPDADLLQAMNMGLVEVMESSGGDLNEYGVAWNKYFAGETSTFAWDKCNQGGDMSVAANDCAARINTANSGKQGHQKAACEIDVQCTYAKSSLVDDSTAAITWPAKPTTGRLFDVLNCRKFSFCMKASFAPFRPPRTSPGVYPGVANNGDRGFDYDVGDAIIAKIADQYLSAWPKDTCCGVDCGTNGSCAAGTCTCSNDFTGTNCETAPTTADACEGNSCPATHICINGHQDTTKNGTCGCKNDPSKTENCDAEDPVTRGDGTKKDDTAGKGKVEKVTVGAEDQEKIQVALGDDFPADLFKDGVVNPRAWNKLDDTQKAAAIAAVDDKTLSAKLKAIKGSSPADAKSAAVMLSTGAALVSMLLL